MRRLSLTHRKPPETFCGESSVLKVGSFISDANNRLRTCSFCLLLTISLSITGLFSSANAIADDNLIAHQLFTEGRYAEAAEIFTDPAWKGTALYRSSQWWRAAEAFVRADDADSIFNLGNSYVMLGYYELALDAYLTAIKKRPDFASALFNADLMRQLLAAGQNGEATGLLKPGKEEIETIASEDEDVRSGEGGDESTSEDTENKKDQGDREGDTDDRAATPTATAAGESDEAGSDKTPGFDEQEPGGDVKGSESEPTQEVSPASASEGDDTTPSDVTAGIRTPLQTLQATDQWLNQINHDAGKFLKAQIELEARRRKAAGQAPPAGGSQW